MRNKVLQSSRVDEQVLFTFLGIGLLSVIILGFRYTTRSSCMPITIQVGGDTIQGHLARFNAQTEGGKTFVWDFDDNDNENTEELTASITHKFKNPGKHTVSVLINGNCTEFRDIFVLPPEPGSNADLQPKIVVASDSVILGAKVLFTDANSRSVNFDWNFGEPGSPGSHEKAPFYQFTTLGRKLVTLQVNGKPDLRDSKYIYVIQKEKAIDDTKQKDIVRRPIPDTHYKNDPVSPPITPPQQEVPVKKETEPPPPLIVKAPDLPKGLIEGILKQVPEGGEWKEPLSKYLCGDFNVPVIYNSKTTTTLAQFCAELKKMKTKKIKDITVIPTLSKQTNCIIQLGITIDKKKFIGLF